VTKYGQGYLDEIVHKRKALNASWSSRNAVVVNGNFVVTVEMLGSYFIEKTGDRAFIPMTK